MRRAGSSPTRSRTAATDASQSYSTRRQLDARRRRSPRRRRGGRRPSGIPTLPGLSSSMPLGPVALELDVRVAEHDALRRDAHRAAPRRAGPARRRSSACRSAARRGSRACRRCSVCSGSPTSSRHELVAEQLGGARRDLVDRRRRVVAVHQPAVGVPADPRGVLELLQPLDRLTRPGARRGVVAAEQELAGVVRRRPAPPRAPAGCRGCRRGARATDPHGTSQNV